MELFSFLGGPLSPFSPSSLRYPSPFPQQSSGSQGPPNSAAGTPGGYPVNRTSPFQGGPNIPTSPVSGPNGTMSGPNNGFYPNGPHGPGMSSIYPGGNPRMTSPNPHQTVGPHSSPIAAPPPGGPTPGASVTVKQEVISSPGTPGSIGSPVPAGAMMNPACGPNGYPGGLSPGQPYPVTPQNPNPMSRPSVTPPSSSSLAQLQQMQMRHAPQGNFAGPPNPAYNVGMAGNHPSQTMGGPNPAMHPGQLLFKLCIAFILHCIVLHLYCITYSFTFLFGQECDLECILLMLDTVVLVVHMGTIKAFTIIILILIQAP
jgi:hypothetical protein